MIAVGVLGPSVLTGLLVFPGIRSSGSSTIVALAVSALAVAGFVAGTALTVGLIVGRRAAPSAVPVYITATYAVFTLLLAYGALGIVGLPLLPAAGLAAVAAGVQARSALRNATGLWQRSVWLRKEVESPEDARRLLVQTAKALAGDELRPGERDGVLVNRAKALTFLSALPGEREALDEAMSLVREVVESGRLGTSQAPQWVAFDAALALFNAWDFSSARSGDDHGLEESLGLLEQVASKATGRPRRVQLCEYHAARLQLGSWRLDRLMSGPEPDPDKVAAQLRDAIDAAEKALEYVDKGSEYELSLQASYAQVLGAVDRERAIAVARSALSSARWRQRREVAFLRLILGGLLAAPDDDPGTTSRLAELLEADVVFAELIADVAEPLRPLAAYQRATLRMRLLGLGLPLPVTTDGDPAEIWSPSESFRAAEESAGEYNGLSAARWALEWAQWAGGAGRTAEAAEAYHRATQHVIEELGYRYDRDEAFALLARVQGVAAEAGYWLLEAGRLDEAIEAVESVRTLLLGQRVDRLSPLLREQAYAVGRADVWSRYAAAVERFEAAERQPAPPSGAPSGPGGGGLRAAWSELRRAQQDLDVTLGPVAAQARRPSGSVSPVPVAGDGPPAAEACIVYVGAASRAGWAVRLDAEQTPRYVRLPRFTEQAADRLADTLRRLADGHLYDAADDWQDLLAELGETVTGPALQSLPAGCEVTFIPVGRVALLPLHLARLDADPDRPDEVHVVDRYDVRFGPSLRLLGAAAGLGSAGGAGPEHVLAASVVEQVGQLLPLPEAAIEGEAVCRLYGAHALHRLNARRDDVLDSMHGADVWHLACHATFDPSQPLQAALHLRDGPIRLSDLLTAVRRTTRLAVLSACDSGVPDPQLIDESLSFPAALMASGVRSVVAALWPADSGAAMLVVLLFHRERLAGCPGPQALARAERFLRSATNGELHRALPGEYPVPSYLRDPDVVAWSAAPTQFRHPALWGAFQYTGD